MSANAEGLLLTRDELQERIVLTADAIVALLYYYGEEEPFVFSLVDYLLLLHFEESFVRIAIDIPGQQPRVVLQSMTDEDLAYRGVDVHERSRTAARWEDLEAFGVYLSVAFLDPTRDLGGSLLDQLVIQLRRYPDDYKRILELIVGFSTLRQPPLTTVGLGEQADAPYDFVDSELTKFQHRYWERLIEDAGRAAATLRLADDGPSASQPAAALNLFAVVRYKPWGGYTRTAESRNGRLVLKYNARIMMTDAQVIWVAERLNLPTDVVREALMEPTHDGARWIADTALLSGAIYCGADLKRARHGRDALDKAVSAADRRRHEIETRLYESFGRRRHIVYYPIHVGGTPWLALYSFAEAGEWRHYFHLYRQVIPRIAERTRGHAREAFLDCLVDAVTVPIRDHHTWNQSLIDSINAAWARAALVFPFPAPRVEPISASQQTPTRQSVMFTIGDTMYDIAFGDSTSAFGPQVQFDQLTASLKRKLADRIKGAVVDRYVSRSLRLHGVFNLGHELKNAILETGWYELWQEIERSGSGEELCRGDFVERVRRGLAHMLWPASLVSLVAQLGKEELHAGNLEALRVTQLADGDGFVYDADVREVYRQSVHYVIGYLAGIRHPSVKPFEIIEWRHSVALEDALAIQPLATWLEGAVESNARLGSIELKQLRFPPIRSGRSETEGMRFALASLLSEPTRNAMVALSNEAARAIPRTLLWSVDLDGAKIAVRIANTVPTAAVTSLTRTSTELVNALGRMLGIGAVNTPVVGEAQQEGFRLVVTKIYLYPDRLGRGTPA